MPRKIRKPKTEETKTPKISKGKSTKVTKDAEEKKVDSSKAVEKKELPKAEDLKTEPGERWKSSFHDEEKQKAAEEESKKPEEEKVSLTPAQYFQLVKDEMENVTEDGLKKLYTATYNAMKRYVITKQKAAAKDCYVRCKAMEKEIQLLQFGVTQWVDRRHIDLFIDNVADDCVCIIEMSEYPRTIPDEIVDKVMKTSHLFDQFYILFTDYTGEERQKVAKEKRDKDPILFGNIFIDGKVSNKMYFIGDWEDEYCDLTMSQMMAMMADTYVGDILQEVGCPKTLEEIEAELYGRKLDTSSEIAKSDEMDRITTGSITYDSV